MPVPTAVGDAAGGSMSPLWVSGVNNVFANEASYETLGGAPARPPPGPVGAAVAAVDRLKAVVGLRLFGLADFNRSAVQYVSVSAASPRGAEMD